MRRHYVKQQRAQIIGKRPQNWIKAKTQSLHNPSLGDGDGDRDVRVFYFFCWNHCLNDYSNPEWIPTKEIDCERKRKIVPSTGSMTTSLDLQYCLPFRLWYCHIIMSFMMIYINMVNLQIVSSHRQIRKPYFDLTLPETHLRFIGTVVRVSKCVSDQICCYNRKIGRECRQADREVTYQYRQAHRQIQAERHWQAGKKEGIDTSKWAGRSVYGSGSRTFQIKSGLLWGLFIIIKQNHLSFSFFY